MLIFCSTFASNLGQDISMRILYFTDGAGIDLLGIRESVLRIPEVLTSLRAGQEQVRYVDLMQVMTMTDEEFRLIPSALKSLIINLVQRGLHQRWVNRDHQSDLILRRINHRSVEEVKCQLLQFVRARAELCSVPADQLRLSHFLSRLEITIIGPGYDDVELWLRREAEKYLQMKVCVKDVIASDPQLGWFWPHVSQNVLNHDSIVM